MKFKKLIVYILSMMPLLYSCDFGSQKARSKNFTMQIGEYSLDIEKTKLGNYANDSLLYKNLKIVFNKDSTFLLNMKVPFLYDSAGTWIAEDDNPESWNRLYYRSMHYDSYDINTGNQFTRPWTRDSVFCINGATPQNGKEFIQEIYFKKELVR